MRPITILSLVLLAAVLIVVAHAQEELLLVVAHWGYPGKPIPAVTPGQDIAPLTVTVINPSQTMLVGDLKVELELPEELTWYGEEQTCEPSIPLGPGRNYTCIFFLSVKPDAKPGLIKIKVRLEYTLYNAITGEYIATRDEEHEVKLPVVGYSSISIVAAYFNVNASFIGPGAENLPLVVQILNTGTTTLYNVTVSLVLEPPLYALVNGRRVDVLTKTVGVLPPGQPVPLIFPVSISTNTTGGCFYEKAVIRVGTSARSVFETRFRVCIPSVDVKVVSAQWGAPGLEQVYAGPGMTSVPFTVYLVSTTYIKEAEVCIRPRPPILDTSPILCRNVTFVGGGVIPVVFMVNLGYYKEDNASLVLTVRYGDKVIEKSFTVALPKPDVRVVALVPSPPVLVQDMGLAVLNVTLVNTGSGCAKNVRVEVETPPGIEILTRNMSRLELPLLPPGQKTTLSIPVKVGSVEPGLRLVRVRVCVQDECRAYAYQVKVLEKPRFEVVSVSTQDMYPGSDHAVVKIVLRYVSGPKLVSAAALLMTPSVLSVKVPEGRLVLGPERTVFGELVPGDTVSLVYVLEVDSSTPPGNYNATLVIQYVPEELAPYMSKMGTLAVSIPLTLTVYETLYTLAMKHIPEIGCAVIALIAVGVIVAARRRRRGT